MLMRRFALASDVQMGGSEGQFVTDVVAPTRLVSRSAKLTALHSTLQSSAHWQLGMANALLWGLEGTSCVGFRGIKRSQLVGSRGTKKGASCVGCRGTKRSQLPALAPRWGLEVLAGVSCMLCRRTALCFTVHKCGPAWA